MPQQDGQREGHRPRHNQSEHQPITQHAHSTWRQNKENEKKKCQKGTQYVLIMVSTLKVDKMMNSMYIAPLLTFTV